MDKFVLFLSGAFSFLSGYLVKLGVDLIVKHQERRNSLEKMIVERRLCAHEDIINIVRSASTGMGIFQDNDVILQPAILYSLETFYEWQHKFINAYQGIRHLIDRELDYRLWIFHNYLYNLDRLLNFMLIMRDTSGKSEEDIEKIKAHESARLIRIGEVIYPDMKKLTSDVLEEASKFFSTGIYETKFMPSAILVTEYSLPEYFTKLALFSRGKELLDLAKFRFPDS